MKYQQHEQRADARRRQGGENRQRMNVAFIQHAENDVHGHQRRENQIGLALQRTLKGLRSALEVAGDGGGEAHCRGCASDAVNAITRASAAMRLPATITGNFQGTAQAFQSSRKSQPYLILAALVAVYIILGM